jgi:Na+:H+ antiporter, NhaA family
LKQIAQVSNRRQLRKRGARDTNALSNTGIDMYRVSSFMGRFAISLLLGIALATVWVNLDPASYYDMIEWRITDLSALPLLWPDLPSLTPLHLVAEVLIPFFFFFIGKELWEAIVIERGALAGRQAILPIMGAMGAILGGVVVWRVLAWMIDPLDQTSLATGWPTSIGGDVVLVYLFGKLSFERKSSALHLVLLVVIALDLIGLILLGLTHPNGGLVRMTWLGLPLAASLGVWWFHGRKSLDNIPERARRRIGALWPYVLAGLLSYIGVVAAGLPGALGLLPVIPAIAHADRSFGLFAHAEEFLHDPLNRLAHALIHPITGILFLYGLTRGGFEISAFAPPTLLVLFTFFLGKPIGFLAATLLVRRFVGVRPLQDLGLYALVRVSVLIGLGFSVPVLALDTALLAGEVAEAARLGLALTFGAGLISLLLPRSSSK